MALLEEDAAMMDELHSSVEDAYEGGAVLDGGKGSAENSPWSIGLDRYLSWNVLKMEPYPQGYTSRECATLKLPVSSTVKIIINFMIEIRVMNT